MRSTLGNIEKEEMISSRDSKEMENKNIKARQNIKKHESYCKGDNNYVMRDKVGQYADKKVVVTNDLAENNHLESSRKHYTDETDILDSTDV